MRRTLAVLATAAALTTAAPAVAQEQMTPSVTVSPNVSALDPAGEKITITGTGFDPRANDGKGWGVRVGPKRDGWRGRTTTTSQYSKLLRENWAVGIDLKPDGTWQATPTVKATYKAGSEEFSAAAEQLYLMIFSWDNPDMGNDLVVPLQFTGVTSPSEPRQGSLHWPVVASWNGTPSAGTTGQTWPYTSSTQTTAEFGGRIDFAAPKARITTPRVDLGAKTLTVDVNGVTVPFAGIKAGQPTFNGNTATLRMELELTEKGSTALNLPANTALAPATMTYPVAAPTLALAQAEIPQNGTLSFTGQGFSAGEQVILDGRATFAADQEGGVAGELVATAAPGRHTLTATGLSSRRTADATYTVKAAGCEVTSITKGTLLWGFKKSFREYVGKGSGNSITGANGAVVTDVDASPNTNGVTTGAHRYPFKEARYTSATQFEVAFGGTITFTYPGHFFTIHLANPKVAVKDAKGTLSADVELVTSGPTPGKPTKLTGVELADLDLAAAKTTVGGGVLTITGVRSTLTNSDAFAGFYGAGDKLDDLTLTLGSSCSALPQQPGPAGPPPVVQAPQDLVPPLAFRPQRLAGTGASALAPSIAGFVLLVSGITVLTAARRRTSPGRRT
ncbi:Htaa protein [Lentzea albidocapillata subsp. violacea]|uniref:Htaa protein n=1 Tax=Lentzea albidocapillata subsp. violacea TaxID=128104 RepID=A0A1G9IVI7_9PSEU|nr:HtaA domain-containing protein [Lentzea albidocapillata]SDL29076.1 Htaa protein [Lentzea albidocapillata subsp. violacea]